MIMSPLTITVTNSAGEVLFVGQPTGAPEDTFCIHRNADEPGRLQCSVPEIAVGEPIQQKLPPFSGDHKACPKCGYDDAPTTGIMYLSMGICDHTIGQILSATGVGFNERLHRACFRCGHAWDEAVVS